MGWILIYFYNHVYSIYLQSLWTSLLSIMQGKNGV